MMQALSASQNELLQIAQKKLAAGQADAALAAARSLVQASPNAPDAQQFLGMCLGQNGQLGEAEAAFITALRLAPGHPLILTNLAALYRKGGALDAAIRSLRQAVSQAPDFGRGWQDLGRCLLDSGQPGSAVAALEEAIRLQPGAVASWRSLGRARRAIEDHEGAEEAFKRALELVPGHGITWLNLGGLYRECGRASEALDCYQRAAGSGYGDPDLADARVGALIDLGQTESALEQARLLVGQHPGFVDGQRTLAHLLWEYGPALAPGDDPLGHFSAAVEQLGDRNLRLAYARFLLESRQAEKALRQFDILRSEADHPMLKAMAGNAHELLGQSAQAGALYAAAHRDLGSDPAFLCAYSRHLLKAGEWQKARDLSAQAVAINPDDQEAWAYLGTAWRLLHDDREFWLCDYERLVSLHAVPAPVGYKSHEAFMDDLRATLEPMHQARREPVQQSLRGGSQTPGRLFGRPSAVLSGLQESLQATIENWLASFRTEPDHPFHRRHAPGIRFTGSWSVKLWSAGNHVNHIHPQGWISSAYYVALPPSVVAAQQAGDSDAGAIQFGQPPVELDLGLAPRRIIRPQIGHLALFPSYLWHGTVPFTDLEPRITIAFDMRPRHNRQDPAQIADAGYRRQWPGGR